jgi:hypothetical protein
MFMRANRWRGLALGGIVCVAAAVAPAAPALASTQLLSLSSSGASVAGLTLAGSNCSTPALSQPFLSWGDSNWYTLAPGQSVDSFDGTGWTLLTGASIRNETLRDGASGPVLDLPPLSIAISPPVCVESDYPTARAIVKTTLGAHVSVVALYADALGDGVTENALQTGPSGELDGSSAWAPSGVVQVHPGDLPGWQVVQFAFVNLSVGNLQLYDFYVDPRMSD